MPPGFPAALLPKRCVLSYGASSRAALQSGREESQVR